MSYLAWRDGEALPRRVGVIVVVLATLVVSFGVAAPARAATPAKVAIIVGPVGEELTPVYISLADAAATAAETRGATVATAYSPDANAEQVLAAVDGANIVIYFGHGIGTPNPYSDHPNAATTNGWGLNGPKANANHAASAKDESLTYYGEAWIAENARPAPGWVMIYSNACYAPGASEGFDKPADETTAAARVAAYSRAPLADLGASAYFATDFYEGAAHLVGKMLDSPTLPYGDVFASEPNFVAEGVTRLPHALIDGAETWLHRSAYFEGKLDYWYAFAGDPNASLAGGITGGLPWQPGMAFPETGATQALATAYSESPGHQGEPTVALPAELAALLPPGASTVQVCAVRCADLPVVAELPTSDGPIAAANRQAALAISQHAWVLITDRPLSGAPLEVRLRLHAPPPVAAVDASSPAPSEAANVLPPPSPPAPPAVPSSPPGTSPPTPAPTPIPATPPVAPSGSAPPPATPVPPPTPTAEPSRSPSPSPVPPSAAPPATGSPTPTEGAAAAVAP